MDLVWPIVDIMNGLMALPNLIALFFLSKDVVSESDDFLVILANEQRALTSPTP